MDLKEIKSKDLADYIVGYRLFKTNKSLAISCMNELNSRTDFEWESYVQAKVLEFKESIKPKNHGLVGKLKDSLSEYKRSKI